MYQPAKSLLKHIFKLMLNPHRSEKPRTSPEQISEGKKGFKGKSSKSTLDRKSNLGLGHQRDSTMN